jgi:hypothetical protein
MVLNQGNISLLPGWIESDLAAKEEVADTSKQSSEPGTTRF